MLSKEEITKKRSAMLTISEKSVYQNLTLIWGVPIFFIVLGFSTLAIELKLSPLKLTYLYILSSLVFTLIYYTSQKLMNNTLKNSLYDESEIRMYTYGALNTFLQIVIPFQLLFMFSFTAVGVSLPLIQKISLLVLQSIYLVFVIIMRWYYSKNKVSTTIYFDGEKSKLFFFDIFMFNYFFYYRYMEQGFDAFGVSMIYYHDADDIQKIFLDHPNILKFHSNFTNRVYGGFSGGLKQILIRDILPPAFIFLFSIPIIFGIITLDLELWFLLTYGVMLLLLNIVYLIIGSYLEKQMYKEFRSFIGENRDQIKVFHKLYRILQIDESDKFARLFEQFTWWVGRLSMEDTFRHEILDLHLNEG